MSKIKIIKESEVIKTEISHSSLFLKNVILSNNEVPNLFQLATAEFIPGSVIDMHSHGSMTEIFYLISGCLELFTNDNSFLINHGDTIVIPPGQNHSFKFLDSTRIIYFNLLV